MVLELAAQEGLPAEATSVPTKGLPEQSDPKVGASVARGGGGGGGRGNQRGPRLAVKASAVPRQRHPPCSEISGGPLAVLHLVSPMGQLVVPLHSGAFLERPCSSKRLPPLPHPSLSLSPSGGWRPVVSPGLRQQSLPFPRSLV